MKWWKRTTYICAVLGLLFPASTFANTPTSLSAHYGITEDNISNGGSLNSTSAHFSELGIDDGGSTLGDFTTGNSTSNSYQTNSGFNTTDEPGLTMIVNTGSADFGNVTVGTMATALATFSVKDYTSYGYAVSIIGNAPTYGGHTLTSLTSDTAYSAIAEQFGINLVLNTTAAVGANPVQVPSSSFSFGVAGDGATGTFGTTRPYTISDKWRFNSGDTVASSPKTSGETDYTMTFMMNAIASTPGGKYVGNIDLVATGTY